MTLIDINALFSASSDEAVYFPAGAYYSVGSDYFRSSCYAFLAEQSD